MQKLYKSVKISSDSLNTHKCTEDDPLSKNLVSRTNNLRLSKENFISSKALIFLFSK